MRFSVVIATCGRPDLLRKSLAAVARSIAVAGEPSEILVVDNSPDRRMEPVVHEFTDHAYNIRYITSDPFNKAKALNVGIRAAQYDWLAFTDDDTEASPEWLQEASAFAETGGFRYFGGRVEPDFKDVERPRWLTPGKSGVVPRGGSVISYILPQASGRLVDDARGPIGANAFAHRSVFEEHGFYDEELWQRCGWASIGTEDGEMGIRLRNLGEPVGYCHQALIWHSVDPERMRIRFHLYCMYRSGYRDPIVWGRKEIAVRWAVVGIFTGVWGAIKASIRHDMALAMHEFLRVVFSAGRIVGLLHGVVSRWRYYGNAT